MKKFHQILSYVLVAIAASFVTLLLADKLNLPGESKLDQLQSLIADVFIEDYDETAAEDAAAAAMVDALGNQWSHYISADEYQSYKDAMNNSYVGIGITISMREDGYIDVLKVEDGGPAQEAGLLPGDIITTAEGQDISGMTMGDVQNIVRGKPGTQVELGILREETKLILQVTRKEIRTVVATSQMVEDGIGLVKIVNFDSRCKDETLAAVEALLQQGAEALIFDVRYNPGGHKDELVKILDYLLPEGPLFRSEHYDGTVSVDESDAKCLQIPMVVLMNGDSYSAAEFFAAALREYDAAVLVGEPTTGKGHYQYTYTLSDGSAVVLSVGKYYTPDGVSLAGVGLTPDVTVEVDEETYYRIYRGEVPVKEDVQIQAAIKALKTE